MRNVDIKVTGKTMTITVNLAQKGVLSASGKSLVIATTEGNQRVDAADVIVGLNVYRKA